MQLTHPLPVARPSTASLYPRPAAARALAAPRSWHGFLRHCTRPRRILLLLAVLWLLNVLDLRFTMLEASGNVLFNELNPVAAHLLGNSLDALVAYKLTLVALASLILWRLRSYSPAEWGTWLATAAYAAVFMQWMLYFHIAPDFDTGYYPPLRLAG